MSVLPTLWLSAASLVAFAFAEWSVYGMNMGVREPSAAERADVSLRNPATATSSDEHDASAIAIASSALCRRGVSARATGPGFERSSIRSIENKPLLAAALDEAGISIDDAWCARDSAFISFPVACTSEFRSERSELVETDRCA